MHSGVLISCYFVRINVEVGFSFFRLEGSEERFLHSPKATFIFLPVVSNFFKSMHPRSTPNQPNQCTTSRHWDLKKTKIWESLDFYLIISHKLLQKLKNFGIRIDMKKEDRFFFIVMSSLLSTECVLKQDYKSDAFAVIAVAKERNWVE